MKGVIKNQYQQPDVTAPRFKPRSSVHRFPMMAANMPWELKAKASAAVSFGCAKLFQP